MIFIPKKGVRIICNAKVTNLNAENQMIHSVSLESGESLAADIVLVGIGAIPNTAACRFNWLRMQQWNKDRSVL